MSRELREARAGALATPVPQVLGGLGLELRDVVLICDTGAVRLARDVAAAAPRARIHLLTTHRLPREQQARLGERVSVSVCRTQREREDLLAALPQPQAILDHAGWGTGERLGCFTGAFLFLAPEGAYLMRTGPAAGRGAQDPGAAAGLRDLLGRGPERTGKELPHRRAELAAATGDVSVQQGLVVARKRLVHRYKLRESHAEDILQARFGQAWGEVVTTRPAQTYRSAADLVLHGEQPDWHGQAAAPAPDALVTVPPLALRRYSSVRCWSHQRVAREGYWLPDTYRHQQDRYLMHRKLASSSPRHARLPEQSAATERAARRLPGSYYYFDSEYPGHFGHVLTELLSRVWGWQEAQRRDPDLRPLLSLEPGQAELPAFERHAFGALGVDLSTAELVSSEESVQVQTLYAATPGFVMPQYASPHLGQVWAAVGELAVCRADRPRLLFVARRVRPKRSCLDTQEVESFFERLGFTKVYPEDVPFEEQIGLFQHADVIAGFSGSGLFSMMFAPGKTVIVIRADTFTATNEYLIYSVIGGRLHSFWGQALTKHPPGRWTWGAYQSNFTFDVKRFGPEIEAAVEQAAG